MTEPGVLSVEAVVASDYDGDRHLVALQDDVDGWEVTVTRTNGAREVVHPSPARAYYYNPELAGRPSWFIDHDLGRAQWELLVHGEPVKKLIDTRPGRSE